jgi:hypothetical protein
MLASLSFERLVGEEGGKRRRKGLYIRDIFTIRREV